MQACRIAAVPTGRFDGRSYILFCPEDRGAVVIDPDVNMAEILRMLEAEKASVQYILLTHGHFDHVSSADALRGKTGAKVAIHRLDIPTFSDPELNMSGPFGLQRVAGGAVDMALEEGSEIAVCGAEIRTLHTPGHTPGSCCFLAGQDIFTGDTLFRGAVGRTDFPGGDAEALVRSCMRLLALDGALTVHPGHGGPSTIAREREANPVTGL